MFTLQPGDELVFGTPSISEHDHKLFPDNLITGHACIETNIINFSSSSSNNNNEQRDLPRFRPRQGQSRSRDEYNIRRILHRNIERRRRQEMSNLYTSLRSLLPLDHVKGRRSVCDHMQEAVNYIQHMQKNVQELRSHRDKLKKLPNLSSTKAAAVSNGGDNLPNCSVTVEVIRDGVEILISSSMKNSEFRLSRVLAELLERQLNVVTCVSTNAKEGFLHKIQAEASDMTKLDPLLLQERLTKAIIS
ncbi:transcription factor bHLH118-like [Sesamum indicum]|uniref:Transcription factor bHLH118-like n=1 Tax=Sesamum indicum TaxID=4182 RepID=A0A6I9SZL3_SESIN|nr:transcription factor bHLH118-like [Sesamum indicum]